MCLKTVEKHAENADTPKPNSTMKTFEAILPEDRFLRIHKSYIVNLDKVLRYNSKVIELEQQQLPLSRNRKSQLIEALSASMSR